MKARRIATICVAACLAWSCLAAGSPIDDLRQRADQGDAEAARRVATAYDSGMGAPRDDVEAARWYERAARLGDADAQFRLGVLYREGRGVLKDGKKAYAWFDLAASNADFLDRDDAAFYRDDAAAGLDAADLAAAKDAARALKEAVPPARP